MILRKFRKLLDFYKTKVLKPKNFEFKYFDLDLTWIKISKNFFIFLKGFIL